MTAKIWTKNWEIRRVSFLLSHEAPESFLKLQNLYFGSKILTQIIWVNENQDNTATYFLKPELRRAIDATFDLVVNNPGKVSQIHRQAIEHNRDLFRLLKKTQSVNLAKFSNQQLALLYSRIFKKIQLAHGSSFYSTYLVDADGEDLTNYLINKVRQRIIELKLKLNFAEVFSLLTTPTRINLEQLENRQFLAVLSDITADSQAKKLFLGNLPDQIEKKLNELDPRLKRKIVNHHRRWQWIPYDYLGPAYELGYYLEIWRGLLKQKININKEIAKLVNGRDEIRKQKNKLFKQLEFNRYDRQIFDLASEIVWLKSWRKEVLFFASFIVDKVYQELARRCHISFNQARHLTNIEVAQVLSGKVVPINELNQRIKFVVIHFKSFSKRIMTGATAKKFMATQHFEKIKIVDAKELKGTPACPGKVKGLVKIVNVPDEMSKMKSGNIMVAHSTYPSLVPAMKKAGAIITEDGGLTCHAAIVARELKIPCVVGTRIAAKVLKDGDMVEVDATNGIIKKV
ncbi:MAG: PEP-utilizing enzyme [Patescibacteria group bacterium]|jgi:phosphohistidine swiveling domain-containing protein|nr:PEP-utilizing enzyme [Patescibacteria group bacterium]